jgi:hypothetical protein
MTDKDTTGRAACRYALAELRRRHADEFKAILVEKRADLRGEVKSRRKATARSRAPPRSGPARSRPRRSRRVLGCESCSGGVGTGQ